MGSLSPVHWIIVIVVVLLLFGPRRLGGIGHGLGRGFRELRNGLAEISSDR
jgi:sec-independent protein translocase protein TatA